MVASCASVYVPRCLRLCFLRCDVAIPTSGSSVRPSGRRAIMSVEEPSPTTAAGGVRTEHMFPIVTFGCIRMKARLDGRDEGAGTNDGGGAISAARSAATGTPGEGSAGRNEPRRDVGKTLKTVDSHMRSGVLILERARRGLEAAPVGARNPADGRPSRSFGPSSPSRTYKPSTPGHMAHALVSHASAR